MNSRVGGASFSAAPVGILCRPKLGSQLRRMCDKIGTRLWIASPYVGSWEVRKVLGRRWFDGDSIDVRLLTDPDERIINRNTALRFAEKGTIKKLRGLHAKLFIVDDQVLLTSANLTYSAFAMRHEVGIVLDGDAARSAVSQFESWWKMAMAQFWVPGRTSRISDWIAGTVGASAGVILVLGLSWAAIAARRGVVRWRD